MKIRSFFLSALDERSKKRKNNPRKPKNKGLDWQRQSFFVHFQKLADLNDRRIESELFQVAKQIENLMFSLRGNKHVFLMIAVVFPG